MKVYLATLGLVILSIASGLVLADQATPKIGETAKSFELKTLNDKTVKLDSLIKQGPVVLVVLRGYPGYQCPICTRQVATLRGEAKAFKQAGVSVVLVYPGPADNLKTRAKEFLNKDTLPAGFSLVIDPDYKFTNAYGLRWKAQNETAYPSAFVIDKQKKVVFRQISRTHGGRVKTKALLKAIPE